MFWYALDPCALLMAAEIVQVESRGGVFRENGGGVVFPHGLAHPVSQAYSQWLCGVPFMLR